ncbi:hypothetical protein MBAV_006245 [Candidatus Magnetobacterium bavaricum]|uniref:Uncharacterized protein n=1 Tax=Candidatus Magnetobacterium bavaricum TaxID=29290 RepID=A0A0F3GHY2_9BACT|nr:hypothetical protein MBAV_006245 [Candidatus Magnetobacterium bavaricum]
MKDVFIILWTEDMYHPTTRRCIETIKAADLSMAELITYDNVCNPAFAQTDIYEDIADYCEGRPIILIGSNILIQDAQWVYKLINCANSSGASVVGCVHKYKDADVGYYGVEFNVEMDIINYIGATTPTSNAYAYTCAVAGPLVLIMNPNVIHFDPDYGNTDHIYLDICMQQWLKGGCVAAALDVNATNIGDPMRNLQYFKSKWGEFIKNELPAKINRH